MRRRVARKAPTRVAAWVVIVIDAARVSATGVRQSLTAVDVYAHSTVGSIYPPKSLCTIAPVPNARCWNVDTLTADSTVGTHAAVDISAHFFAIITNGATVPILAGAPMPRAWSHIVDAPTVRPTVNTAAAI